MAAQTINEFHWEEAVSIANYVEMYFIKVEALLATVSIKHADAADVVNGITGPIRAKNYLMTICGDQMLTQIIATDGYATKTYAEIKTAMKTFFKPKNSRLNEYKFLTTKPNPQEKFSEYAKRMRPTAAAIGIAEDVIDHRIMMQILLHHKHISDSDDVRDKIMNTDTTLATLCTWQEAQLQSAQVDKLNAEQSKTSMNRLTNDQEATINQLRRFDNSKNLGSRNTNQSKNMRCFNCGEGYPHQGQCPYFNRECNKCHRTGHKSELCEQRQKRFAERREKQAQKAVRYIEAQPNCHKTATKEHTQKDITVNPNPEQTPETVEVWRYVNTIRLRSLQDPEAGKMEQSPEVDVSINGTKFKHLADTGAQVNTMSKETFAKLKPQPQLNSAKHKLMGYHGSQPIPTKGQFECAVTVNGITQTITYVVINNEKPIEDILCYKTLISLDIIRMVRQIENVSFEQKIVRDFPSLFENRIGHMPNVQVHFDTNPSMLPVQQPAYDIPVKLVTPSREKILELINQGVVEEVTYGDEVTWISPMQPVMKGAPRKNGSKRDFKRIGNEDIKVRITANSKCLNKAIIKRKRPMPSVHRLASSLNGKKFYSVCDIKDAFSTVELTPECRIHTTFATPWGKLYRYCRLTMGLNISSEAFQDVMTSKTRDLKHIRVAIDDILVATETEEEHDLALNALLTRLVELNLTLNIDKCKFKASEVNFFGMVLSKEGIKPNEGKVQDFLDATNPTNKRECVSFLCLAQYFAKRIPKLAELSIPLKEICRTHAVFNWLPIHSQAIRDIKEALIRECLCHFDESGKLDTELWVDAGPTGVAGFLVQVNPETNERFLVSCMSNSFNPIEKRYAQVEKEGLSALKACEHFYLHLVGQDFKLYTDNKAIALIMDPEAIQTKKTPIRLNHWRSRLTQFSRMCPQFVEGERNIADYLSRCLKQRTCIAHSDTFDTELAVNRMIAKSLKEINSEIERLTAEISAIGVQSTPETTVGTNEQEPANIQEQMSIINNQTMITIEEIMDATNNDKTLSAIIEHIRDGHKFLPSKDSSLNGYRQIFAEMSVSQRGVLLYNDLIVIPPGLGPRMVKLAHRCHVGLNSTMRFLQNNYFILGLNKMVKAEIETCMACQATTNVSHYSPITPSELPKTNWSKTSMDFTSKLPNGKYAFVLKCDRSRYILFKFSSRLNTAAVIKMLMEVFSVFGIPDVIKSDNGPAFISHDFAAFAKRMGFTHQKITPIYPPANGGVERVMKDVNKVVRCAQINDTPIEAAIRAYLKQYHATPNSMTLLTPNEMMGFKDETGFPSLKIGKSEKQINKTATANDSRAKTIMAKHANADKHTKENQLKVNDTVMVKLERTNKFQPIYDPSLLSPYVISGMNGSMISAQRSNPPHEITRNCSFFRKIVFKQPSQVATTEAKAVEQRLVRLPVLATDTPVMNERVTPPPTPALLEQFVLPNVELNPNEGQGETNRPRPAGRPRGSRNQHQQVAGTERTLRSSSNTANNSTLAPVTRSSSNSPTTGIRDALNGSYWKIGTKSSSKRNL